MFVTDCAPSMVERNNRPFRDCPFWLVRRQLPIAALHPGDSLIIVFCFAVFMVIADVEKGTLFKSDYFTSKSTGTRMRSKCDTGKGSSES